MVVFVIENNVEEMRKRAKKRKCQAQRFRPERFRRGQWFVPKCRAFLASARLIDFALTVQNHLSWRQKKRKEKHSSLLLASSLLILTSWSADFQLKSFRIYSRAIEITSRRSFSMIYCSSKYSCRVVKIGGTVHGTVDYICELFQIFQRVFSWSLPPDTDPGPCPSAAAAFVNLQVMTAPCFSKFHHKIVKMCYHDNSIVDYICEFFEIF